MAEEMDIYQSARTKILNEIFAGDKFPKKISELDANQLKKIDNHAIRYGHTIQEVLDAVLNNEVAFRAIVGKNPEKMDYFETTLISYLRKFEFIISVEKLPKSGTNAKYIVNGKIMVGGGRRSEVKSLDIEVVFKNHKKLYLVHKYTMEDGGAQDNQFREAKETLKHVYTKEGKIEVNLGAVLDGDYYVKKRAKSTTRIELAELEHPDTFICTYKTFKEKTKTIWSQE